MNPTATARKEAVRDPTAQVASPLRIWGGEPWSLHDLLWASRCMQVVRSGSGAGGVRKGPALYLLVRADQLVLLDMQQILKKMHWAAPRAVRLRVAVRDSKDYTEAVAEHADGIRFVREYGRAVRRCERVWITAEIGLAREWAAASDARAGTRAIRGLVETRDLLSIATEGFSGAADEVTSQDWLAGAMSQWKRINAVLPHVFEYQPGVWVHERARLNPGVRIVGNAWIGADVSLDAGTVVAGPVLIADDVSPDPVAETTVADVDWDLTRSPHWSLPSLTSGSSMRRLIKRCFDVVFSLCVLVGTLPLYVPILIAIALEDGRPFFFAHTRQTLGGREFPCLKFRTMRSDAEQVKAALLSKNAADGPQFYMEDDPRVTRVGRILRKYQLDEFPQFLNVLAGHMSVVGPRPSPEKENQYCPTWREARLSVRPGVTGLWQVSRTREPQTDFQEWIRYDLEYVQHQSFVGDLRIIFETVRGILT
mgnify:CR=1 FL=1